MMPPIIRTSERTAFKRCTWAWWQRYRMGLVPRGAIRDALWFGTGVHIALAGWYSGPGMKRGPHPAETFAAWADGEIRSIKTSNTFGTAAEALIEDKLVPALELGTVLMQEYVKLYGRDDSWSVIQPEYSGQLDIADPYENNQILAIYAFTYDGVYRDLSDGKIWLMEHKTARSISTEHLQLDDQGGAYYATAATNLRAAGLIRPKERLQGINYNFIRKSLPDQRPRNPEGYFTNKPTKADYTTALEIEEAGSYGYPEREQFSIWLKRSSLQQLQQKAESLGLRVHGEISKLQPKPLFERHPIKRTAPERARQIQRITDEALVMDEFRTGNLPLIKTPDRDHCKWCDFRALCELDEGGHDTTDYRKAMFKVEDPYTDHRKSTEE